MRVSGPAFVATMFCVACWIPPEGTGDTTSGTPRDDRADLVVLVIDEDGAPLANAWVVLTPGGRDASTDEQGEARLHDVGTGVWTATLQAEGRIGVEQAVEVVEEEERVTVTLAAVPDPTTTLAGIVWDPTGDPVVGATIEIDGAATAVTDGAGAWTVDRPDGGSLALVLRPPTGSPWVAAELGVLEIEAGASAWIEWSLAAGPPAGSHFVGSTVCVACHEDIGATYEATAHARAGRPPAEAELDLPDLAASFAAGDVVDLDSVVAGATLTLGLGAEGEWQVTITDATGASAGPLVVSEVYGGHRTGAAMALVAGDTLAVMPAAWALAGQGLSSLQDPAGWVPGWTEGWLDATGTLTLDADGAPGPEASYALQCAGCHWTGAALTADDGAYALALATLAFTDEPRVGCEACHDRGGAHGQATDDRVETILNPARLHPTARVEVCARCHERTTATAHPFDDTPAWPVDEIGDPLGPLDPLDELADPAPLRWLGVPASKVGWDQVGDFRTSPHRTGVAGYLGACEDCHDPHGTEHAANLTHDPNDNTTCTSCHAAAFPDELAEADHAHHSNFDPGDWSPGACTGCHLPRVGIEIRPDAVSGAGELHSHTLTFALPELSLAEFDAASATILPRGSVPLPACLDCHLQADALEEDAGSNCPCPVGDPTRRETYEGMQAIYELVWGGG